MQPVTDWRAALAEAKAKRAPAHAVVIAEARAATDEYFATRRRPARWDASSMLTVSERAARLNRAPRKRFAGHHVPYGTVLACGCRLVPGLKISAGRCVKHYKRDWELLKRCAARGGAPPSWMRWTAPLLCGHTNRPHRGHGCCHACDVTGRWRLFEADYRRERAARTAEWRAAVARARQGIAPQ